MLKLLTMLISMAFLVAVAMPAVCQSDPQRSGSALEQQLQHMLEQGEWDELQRRIEDWTAAGEESNLLMAARQQLALRRLSEQRLEEAADQADKIQTLGFEAWQAQNDPMPAAQALMLADPIHRRSGHADRADQGISRFLSAFDQWPNERMPLGSAVARSLVRRLRADQLRSAGDNESAVALLEYDIGQLRELHTLDSFSANRAAQVLNAQTALMTIQAGEPQLDTFRQSVNFARDELAQRPSNTVLTTFLTNAGRYVSSWVGRDPERAELLLADVRDVLQQTPTDNAELEQAFRNATTGLEQMQQAVETTKRLARLLQKPAPPLEPARWAGGGPVELSQLAGKVTVLSFWAAWWQPSLDALPQLGQLQQHYGPESIQIIGVTMPYNLAWDAAKQQVTRSEQPVTIDEDLAVVQRVIDQLQIPFPTMLLARDSRMPETYAVTSIPHYVIIDQRGIVQSIVVGPPQQSSRQVVAAVSELLRQ
jgi:thiol-disulfide isomerase/thioredoxin